MKKRVVIRGEAVQEVGYRLLLLYLAEDVGLRGFRAENVEGGVLVLIEGDEDKVAKFLEEVKVAYPMRAKISSVDVSDYDGNVIPIDLYYRRLNLEQLIKIVSVGLEIRDRQDEVLRKQDEMLKKQGEMLKKQDEMLRGQDEMLRKQDLAVQMQGEILAEIKGLREDIKADINARIARLEEEIEAIKEKVGLK